MTELITLFAIFLMIFLFGMTVLKIGLYQLSYRKMQAVLTKFTGNPLKGMLTGMLVTALLQSSSTTMVLTVGFVAVGILTFEQSVGVILGANIGTTITAELMSISHVFPIWLFVVIGALLLLLQHRVLFGVGGILFGLGAIFVALQGFESLAEPIKEITAIQQAFFFTNGLPTTGLMIGTVLTAIIQSSSAATGIVMSFLKEGLMTLPSSIAVMLGANIGTCMTAYIAAKASRRKEATFVAMAHIWLNVLGVLLFAPFIHEMAHIALVLSHSPAKQLAHISVLFNVVSSIIVLPFVKKFTNFVLLVHDRK